MTILKAVGVLSLWFAALVMLLIVMAALAGLVCMVFVEVAW